jgi:hypothetical protein
LDGSVSFCPAGAGLQPFGRIAIAGAEQDARRFDDYATSFYEDLGLFDRSGWKELFSDWEDDSYAGSTVISAQPATRDSFAGAVAHACGKKLLEDSAVIDIGGSSGTVSHLYFLDRLGKPLIYFQAS